MEWYGRGVGQEGAPVKSYGDAVGAIEPLYAGADREVPAAPDFRVHDAQRCVERNKNSQVEEVDAQVFVAVDVQDQAGASAKGQVRAHLDGNRDFGQEAETAEAKDADTMRVATEPAAEPAADLQFWFGGIGRGA